MRSPNDTDKLMDFLEEIYHASEASDVNLPLHEESAFSLVFHFRDRIAREFSMLDPRNEIGEMFAAGVLCGAVLSLELAPDRLNRKIINDVREDND